MSKFAHVETWLFDLDDTLYAPSTGFSKHMVQNQHAVLSALLNLNEESLKAYLKSLVLKHGGAPFTGLYQEKSIDMDAFITKGFDLNYTLLSPCSSSVPLLEALKGNKCIFTNSPENHATEVLKSLGFYHIFRKENIFDVTRLGFDTKPLKSSFKQVLGALDVKPNVCVMVEDNLNNLKEAKSLGMTTVLVHAECEKPEYVDYSYPALLDFLEDVNKQGVMR